MATPGDVEKGSAPVDADDVRATLMKLGREPAVATNEVKHALALDVGEVAVRNSSNQSTWGCSA